MVDVQKNLLRNFFGIMGIVDYPVCDIIDKAGRSFIDNLERLDITFSRFYQDVIFYILHRYINPGAALFF